MKEVLGIFINLNKSYVFEEEGIYAFTISFRNQNMWYETIFVIPTEKIKISKSHISSSKKHIKNCNDCLCSDEWVSGSEDQSNFMESGNPLRAYTWDTYLPYWGCEKIKKFWHEYLIKKNVVRKALEEELFKSFILREEMQEKPSFKKASKI
jgi:hypothetical protein